jgi:threonine dehydrogenase-like Zn-dependent dehydrogenase
MRAFVIVEPRRGEVQDVPRPSAGRGEVVVDVQRAGLCGTDHEFFTGNMAYLATGEAAYPMRIGHEWAGTVTALGDSVDPAWLGQRVTGDTMLGCGTCARCLDGRQHLCADRFEVGIRGGWAGALAEQIRVRATSLHAIPDSLDPAAAALVEPAANAWRAVDGARVSPGERLLVIGAGTIGLLAALIARARGAAITIAGRSPTSIDFARSLGFDALATREIAPEMRFDAVIDASTDASSPGFAVDHVEPGRRVSLIGIAAQPSLVDTRRLTLGEITAVGVLSGSGGIAGAIELLASGVVDPRPLVGTLVGLDDVADVLADDGPRQAGRGPKVQVDPRLVGN